MVDAYRQPYIPFYLTTREFFPLARDRLEPGGVVVVNAGHPEGSTRWSDARRRAARQPSPTSRATRSREFNTLLIATDARRRRRALRPRAACPRLRPVLAAHGRAARARARGGTVYTDDKAPVEWLIDRSIVSYAAGDIETYTAPVLWHD